MDSYSASIFHWRLGTESQYVSIYWCPTELHRVVRPLFRLKWPPKVRLLWGLKGHGGPRASLLFKVSTLSHRHGGQKARWAFMHMTRCTKEHHPSLLPHIFSLFLSNGSQCCKKERRANCLLWEPKLWSVPSVFTQSVSVCNCSRFFQKNRAFMSVNDRNEGWKWIRMKLACAQVCWVLCGGVCVH